MTLDSTEITVSKTGSKKISLLLTLKALELAGEERMPIRQINIANMVNALGKRLNLNVCCDRKTVGRHLKLLTAVGYEVTNVKGQGFYIKNDTFTKSETSLLKKIIETSPIIDEEQKKQLTEKVLCRQKTLDYDTLKSYFNTSEENI